MCLVKTNQVSPIKKPNTRCIRCSYKPFRCDSPQRCCRCLETKLLEIEWPLHCRNCISCHRLCKEICIYTFRNRISIRFQYLVFFSSTLNGFSMSILYDLTESAYQMNEYYLVGLVKLIHLVKTLLIAVCLKPSSGTNITGDCIFSDPEG